MAVTDAIIAGLIATALFTALRVRVERKPLALALRETAPTVAAVVIGIVGGRWLDDELFGGTKVVAMAGLIVAVAFIGWFAIRRLRGAG
jgi:hypothetical protein